MLLKICKVVKNICYKKFFTIVIEKMSDLLNSQILIRAKSQNYNVNRFLHFLSKNIISNCFIQII